VLEVSPAFAALLRFEVPNFVLVQGAPFVRLVCISRRPVQVLVRGRMRAAEDRLHAMIADRRCRRPTLTKQGAPPSPLRLFSIPHTSGSSLSRRKEAAPLR
jgi:hypothetical protein